MRTPITFVAAVLFSAAMAAAPADASCKRFGFTVNDYGKDGPTKDAKELLDKHISEWATQQGIKDYKTGPKSVNCELFLNFVVFDEHTCTASANVCWNDGKGKSTPETAAISPEDGEAVPPTPIRKAALLAHDKKAMAATAAATPPAAPDAPASPAAEEAATPPATPAVATTETAAPAAIPPPPPAEPAKAAEAAPTPPPAIETGTLPKDPLSALKKHAAADPAPAAPPPPSVTAPKNDPAAASAAATAAAAAAERAAVAAETAANAAKEAAAAAVAASAASKGSVVPAGDGTP